MLIYLREGVSCLIALRKKKGELYIDLCCVQEQIIDNSEELTDSTPTV